MFNRTLMPATRKVVLFGSVSLVALGSTCAVQAQTTEASPPEEVLVTGSLIRGAPAVGTPVTTIDQKDFQTSGALTVADQLRYIPAIKLDSSPSFSQGGGGTQRGVNVDIHNLNTTTATRTLVLINGMRIPVQGQAFDHYDPSIIPQLAIDHLDVLADGASATYGSDAVAGVLNVVLKRGYDGAQTLFLVQTSDKGGARFQASQLYGRKWDSGDLTVTYEWYQENAIPPDNRLFTLDYRPWGLDDRARVMDAIPGLVTIGAATPGGTSPSACTNCFAIPKGQNGVGLTWAAILAKPGGGSNEINPYSFAELTANQQRNAATMTFDQNIFPGIQLFFDGFYQNRRTQQHWPDAVTPGQSLGLTMVVPTTNPYYPSGAPAGLRVSYNFSDEMRATGSSFETTGRYAGGLNVDLPSDWRGQIFWNFTQEQDRTNVYNIPNANNVSAALGNTVAAVAGVGASVGSQSYTKPANVPYLNVFCDPMAYTCNDPATLNYIAGFRDYGDRAWVNQYGANFDGPLFELPGGQLRAAVGADYESYEYIFSQTSTFATISNTLPSVGTFPVSYNAWAAFGQLNLPIFGDANAVPGIRRLNVELSFRHDQFSNVGGTNNPKVGVTWIPFDDLSIRGSWGTSFRAPEISAIIASPNLITINALNSPAGAANTLPACTTVGGTPVPGSAAAILNPTCSAALQFPGGATLRNSAAGALLLLNRDHHLQPETAKNYSVGFDYTPSISFLKGLELSGTYFNLKITNVLQGVDAVGVGAGLNDPTQRSNFILPGDVPNFNQLVQNFVTATNSVITPALASNIKFLHDGAIRNVGSLELNGVDFSGSYNWNMDGFGDWEAGIDGTYYLHSTTVLFPGATPVDIFNVNGNTTTNDAFGPKRFKYVARVGWTDDPWTATVFMNYSSHYFAAEPLPSAPVLANFPNYSNLTPSFYTFDFSLGYNTGQAPASEYLRNINIQFVVKNFMNKEPPFQYHINANASNPAAYDVSVSPLGRIFALTVTKTW